MVHYYTAFGLVFASDWSLTDLPLSTPVANPDVRITIGETPTALENPQASRLLYQAAPNEFLLRYEGVANYYVTNGNSIVIEPLSADQDAIKLFLLGTTLTALLHQRGLLPLHASVVQIGDSCVAFSGNSGAGKSTLAAQFAKKGYKILSDDVCAIRLGENMQPFVYPAFPQIKLWEDSLHQLGIGTEDLNKVRDELQKFRYIDQNHFLKQEQPLSHLYMLSMSMDQETEITPVNGMMKFQHLLTATHKPKVMIGHGKQNWHFQTCQKVGKNLQVKALRHPYNFAKIDDLIEVILADLTTEI